MTLGRHAGGRLGRQSAPQARVEIGWRHEREARSPVEGLVEGHVTERGQRDAGGTRIEGVVQHGLHQPCPQAATLSFTANRDQMDVQVGPEALRTNEAEELVIRNGHPGRARVGQPAVLARSRDLVSGHPGQVGDIQEGLACRPLELGQEVGLVDARGPDEGGRSRSSVGSGLGAVRGVVRGRELRRRGCREGSGGDEGTRTPGLCDANAALFQLSYIPTERGAWRLGWRSIPLALRMGRVGTVDGCGLE